MKPDFILTSDMHADEHNPISRTDNYWEAFKKKILWLKDIQKQNNGIPIIDCGDLFDSWKSTPTVESWLIENLPQPFCTVIGNHEMPYHNMDRFYKSSLNVLVKAGKIRILNHDFSTAEYNKIMFYGFNYGEYNRINIIHFEKEFLEEYTPILIMHEMVTQERTELFESKTPQQIMKKFPDFDFIFCGHNHRTFGLTVGGENGDRTFLSPGSFTRTKIDQVYHEPHIYLVDAKNHDIEAIPVPTEKNVFDLQQIEIRKNKDERIQNFVETLSADYSIDVSFEKNLELFCEKNKIRNGIREEIQLAMEEK